MELHKVEIRKLISPMKDGAAIFLGNDKKLFTMFIGHTEAAAILREFQNQKLERPMTHDLFHYAILGFDITIKRVVIHGISNNTFFATITMEQQVADENGEWVGRRNEVRIDARPSDSIILALKTGSDIFVTDEVWQQVKDVTDELKNMPTLNFEDGSTQIDFDSLQFDDDDLFPDSDETEPNQNG